MRWAKADTVIVGGGLAGALTMHFLRKAGINPYWIDAGKPFNATNAGAGIMNPITGRKFVYSWRFEDFHEVAMQTYKELELLTGLTILHKLEIWKSLHAPGDENNWCIRQSQSPYHIYIHEPIDAASVPIIKEGFKLGRIDPVYRVDFKAVVQAIVQLWGCPDPAEMLPNRRMKIDGVCHDLSDDVRLVLATGAFSTELVSPLLPLQSLKGEALLIHSADLPEDVILHHHINVVPLGAYQFWVGPADTRHHTEDGPSVWARNHLETTLSRYFDIRYEVIDVYAGVRPSTLVRRPIVGVVPNVKSTWVINGLGTKGASIGPLAAQILAKDLSTGIHPEPMLRWPWSGCKIT
jgi:glycine oxidase